MAARGAEISPEDAGIAVQNWTRRGFSMGKLAGRTVASVESVADPESGAGLRVVKFEGGGFVVTSADDRIDPVVAFSETGDGLRPDDGNPFWVLVRGDVAAREAAAGISRPVGADGIARPRRQAAADPAGTASPTAPQRRWAQLLDRTPDGTAAVPRKQAAAPGSVAVSDVRVDSFVASRWGQGTSGGKKCWNSCTPNNYYAGCVVTVVAQIMRYWKMPDGPVEAKSQYCTLVDKYGDTPVRRLFTMYGGTYDWDAMPLVPSKQRAPTDAQCLEIGKLMYDIGVAVQMEWGGDGSLANLNSAAFALREDFGYKSVDSFLYDSGYYDWSLEEFKKAVVPNMDARCPVAIGIENDVYGHAAIIDGYGYSDGDFLVHVNFGWEGLDDAWYCPPDLSDFTTITDVHCNIFPAATGAIVSGRVLDAGGSPAAGASVSLVQNGKTLFFDEKTDDRGIYAFIVPSGGACTIRAVFGGATAALSVTPGETVPTEIINREGYYYQEPCKVGNRYGNDIRLPDASGSSPESGPQWHSDRASAFAEALREHKCVFLVVGRGQSAATAALLRSCEHEAVKALLREEFVAWYSDCDAQGGETAEYGAGTDADDLPAAFILDPEADHPRLAMATGPQTAADLLSLLSTPRIPPTSVHRFYSKRYRGHFFTIDEAEKDDLIAHNPNWKYEGVAYLAFDAQMPGTTPLYRFYSKNYRGHFFTIDEAEMRTVRDTNRNWKYEGVAYYVYPEPVAGSVPVFRFWSKGYRHHFYTTNEEEKDALIATNPNWKYEGIAFYALADDPPPPDPTEGQEGEGLAPDGKALPEGGGAISPSVAAGVATAWTLATDGGAAVAVPGTTEIGATVVETRADAPNADELVAAARSGNTPFRSGDDGRVSDDAPLALRLVLPEGAFGATLWSAGDGTVAEDAGAEGTFDFEMPATGVWHWLRVRDGDADAFSVWLRAGCPFPELDILVTPP